MDWWQILLCIVLNGTLIVFFVYEFLILTFINSRKQHQKNLEFKKINGNYPRKICLSCPYCKWIWDYSRGRFRIQVPDYCRKISKQLNGNRELRCIANDYAFVEYEYPQEVIDERSLKYADLILKISKDKIQNYNQAISEIYDQADNLTDDELYEKLKKANSDYNMRVFEAVIKNIEPYTYVQNQLTMANLKECCKGINGNMDAGKIYSVIYRAMFSIPAAKKEIKMISDSQEAMKYEALSLAKTSKHYQTTSIQDHNFSTEKSTEIAKCLISAFKSENTLPYYREHMLALYTKSRELIQSYGLEEYKTEIQTVYYYYHEYVRDEFGLILEQIASESCVTQFVLNTKIDDRAGKLFAVAYEAITNKAANTEDIIKIEQLQQEVLKKELEDIFKIVDGENNKTANEAARFAMQPMCE